MVTHVEGALSDIVAQISISCITASVCVCVCVFVFVFVGVSVCMCVTIVVFVGVCVCSRQFCHIHPDLSSIIKPVATLLSKQEHNYHVHHT